MSKSNGSVGKGSKWASPEEREERMRLWALAVALVGEFGAMTIVAEALGEKRNVLSAFVSNHRDEERWQDEIKVFRKLAKAAEKRLRPEKVITGAVLSELPDYNLARASLAIGWRRNALGEWASRHSGRWEPLVVPVKKAVDLARKREHCKPAKPGDKVRQNMRAIAALVVGGKTEVAAAKTLHLSKSLPGHYWNRYPEAFSQAYLEEGIPRIPENVKHEPIRPSTWAWICRAASIVESFGQRKVVEAARRLGQRRDRLVNTLSYHHELWAWARQHARRQLLIPEGATQLARLVRQSNGKAFLWPGMKSRKAHDPSGLRFGQRKPIAAGRPSVGRKKSPARDIIKREMAKSPDIQSHRLANIINKECGREIAEGKMKKMTSAGVRKLIERMRSAGEAGIRPRPV